MKKQDIKSNNPLVVADQVADEILEKQDDKDKRLIILVLFFIAILILLLSSFTFAYLFSDEHQKDNVITTGSVLFSYSDGDNTINIENAMPIDDEVGKKLTGDDNFFDFYVSVGFGGHHKGHHHKNKNIIYEISLVPDRYNTLDEKFVRVYLEENDKPVVINNNEVNNFSDLKDSKFGGKLLYKNNTNINKKGHYIFKMWVSNDYNVKPTSEVFKCKLNVNAYE